MRDRQGRTLTCTSRGIGLALKLLTIAAAALFVTASAQANVGYLPDAANPIRSLPSSYFPHGVAVDASHRVYVAIVTTDANTGAPGEILRLESDLTEGGAFSTGTSHFYTGVAVNPLTQGFYAYRGVIPSPVGTMGEASMDVFSSAGALSTSFAPAAAELFPQIATDSSGNVYFPNPKTGTVQVFNSAGTLQKEISCAGCPGGSLGAPVSVALSSTGDLYVVNLAAGSVLELALSGGNYSFGSVFQSGAGAAAVAVDPADDSVLVGDLPGGRDYHIVAYNSSGIQFDDFGAGSFTDPSPMLGASVAAQIGVDPTTHKLYVSDLGKIHIFERGTIPLPTATANPPQQVGQVSATLRATVNPEGHATLDCEFEYTDDSDFQANSFTNATPKPCAPPPSGSSGTPVEAKITNLSPATVYHYRVTVTTNGGSVASGGETFTTLALAPATITAKPPLGVTQTAATLKGAVNPHGGSVSSCRFEYGLTTSYGKTIACPSAIEPVSTDVEVSRGITGLTADTSYHYRLVVTTNAGTANGADVEFKTSSPPPTEEEPPSSEPTPPSTTTTSPPPSTTVPAGPVVRRLHCRKGFRKKKIHGKMKCVKKKRRARRR